MCMWTDSHRNASQIFLYYFQNKEVLEQKLKHKILQKLKHRILHIKYAFKKREPDLQLFQMSKTLHYDNRYKE